MGAGGAAAAAAARRRMERSRWPPGVGGEKEKNITWEDGAFPRRRRSRGSRPQDCGALRTMELPTPPWPPHHPPPLHECYEIVLAAAPLAALLHDVEWFSSSAGQRKPLLQIRKMLLKNRGFKKQFGEFAAFSVSH